MSPLVSLSLLGNPHNPHEINEQVGDEGDKERSIDLQISISRVLKEESFFVQ